MLILLSTLPRQKRGGDEGAIAVGGYVRAIGAMPVDQLRFMIDTALAECEWMPAPATLSKIAGRWKRSDADVRARRKAARIAELEHQERLNVARRWIRRVKVDPDWLASLDPQIIDILTGEHILRRCPETGVVTQGNDWRLWQKVGEAA